jgi:hypothetical protein
MQHTRSTALLVISDLHMGSIWAPVPEKMVRHDGQVIKPSKAQQWLNRQWHKQTGKALAYLGNRPFDLVLNGDMVEGVHHRSTEHWSADPGDHHLAAWIMLNPIAERAKNIYVVSGTECHDGPSGAAGLGNRLGAVKNPKTSHGAFLRLNLCVNDVYCRFVHHMPTSSRIALYATALGVMLAEHQSQSARLGRKAPRVLVQGHRHTHGYYGDGLALSVSCPPWQLLTTHGHKAATAANPRVGCVVLDFAMRGELPAVHGFIEAVPDE